MVYTFDEGNRLGKERALPWREVSAMTLRAEFVAMASGRGTAIRELCRRFGISPPTAYKWLHRAEVAGVEGLADRSRRPRVSPGKTPAELERIVVELRDAHPTWGGRKLAARLRALGHAD